MGQLKNIGKQLELLFAGYLELDDDEQDTAIDMTVLLLRQMLRDRSGRRQKLTELEAGTKRTTGKHTQRSHAKKARGKLVRKSNAASPQAPIKSVQVTKKNELRRK
ncbi:hypothetical protein [Ruegeria halocynthiae]|uniref:hypothetical protein n=1 Tax=Ruegeria halocynthiae TaxID=985054 RepID=UPI00055F7E84|nr:hypothetical protein [Ruegeria halocynthiae]